MFTDIQSALARHWLACVVSALVFGVAAYGLSLIMKPVYRVEMVLSFVAQDSASGALGALAGQFGGLAALAGLATPQGQAKNEAIAILRSRSFIAEFIEDDGLMPLLFADVYAKAEAAGPGSNIKLPTLNQAVTAFLDSVSTVKEEPTTGLITLQIDWTDRDQALAWARALIGRINETMRARDIQEARRSIEYLQKALGQTSQVGVQEAINRLIEEHLKRSTLADVRRDYAFRVIEPGLVPDVDRPVRPRRVRMTLAGLLLGGMLMGFVVCAREGAFSPAKS